MSKGRDTSLRWDSLPVDFAGYRIEELIGTGRMGVVYRATQLALDRSVAVKMIAPELALDAHFRERFRREARLAAQIEHPHVLPVYEAGEENGQLFLSMRLIDGPDLDELLGREGRLDPPRATAVVVQLGAALDAAHALGLVHRDVKPGNVLIAGAIQEHAYLSDFGLSKSLNGNAGLTLTEDGSLIGTLDYIAPEQLQGLPVDGRTDVYSLGCLLFHLLTGRVPFPRPSEPAVMWAHLSDPAPLVSDELPGCEPFDQVVARALAKDPGDRFSSASELAGAVAAAVEAPETAALTD